MADIMQEILTIIIMGLCCFLLLIAVILFAILLYKTIRD